MELQFEDKFKTFNSALSSYLKKELGKAKGAKLQIKDIINQMAQNRDIVTIGLASAIQTVFHLVILGQLEAQQVQNGP
jgi:hypothetical protein